MDAHAFCGRSSLRLGFDMFLDFEHQLQGGHVANLNTAPLLPYAIPTFTDRLYPDMDDSERLTYVLQFGFYLISEHITTSTFTTVRSFVHTPPKWRN
jgi:hypothetical protein